MDEWILEVIRVAGYIGLMLLMVIENIVPMLPSELILPVAGYLAAEGELNLTAVIACATLGSTIGATAWVALGRKLGRRGIHRFIQRHGRWLLIDTDDVERADAWFARHSKAATFFGRLVPGVRAFISIPAGLSRMPLGLFLFYTAAGSVLWNAALATAGYLLADAYHRAREVLGPVGTILFISAIALLAVRYVRKRRIAAN